MLHHLWRLRQWPDDPDKILETLRAEPAAVHGGRIRITEQGEVVSLKYSSPAVAVRNLEQLTSAVVAAECLPTPEEKYRDRLAGW